MGPSAQPPMHHNINQQPLATPEQPPLQRGESVKKRVCNYHVESSPDCLYCP